MSNTGVCIIAATHYGFNIDNTKDTNQIEKIDQINECILHYKVTLLTASKRDLVLEKNLLCESPNESCRCTEETSCLCTSNYYIEHKGTHRQKRKIKANEQFVVTWDLSLGSQESLLESKFLKAGFEQSVKDYINSDILCSDNLEVKGAEFFGVQIPDPVPDKKGKMMVVSGNGKCKVDLSKCQKPVKKKVKKWNGYSEADASRVVRSTHEGADFCEVFFKFHYF